MFFLPKIFSLLAVIGGAFVDPAIAAPAPSAFSFSSFVDDFTSPSYVMYCRNSTANNYGDCTTQQIELSKCQEVSPGWDKDFDTFDCMGDMWGCQLYTGPGCTGDNEKLGKLYTYVSLGSLANNVSSFECDRT